YRLDGTLKTSINVPGGIKHIPFLADVNNDGSLDVVYRSLAGLVYVQNFGAKPRAAVSWATHRGNKWRDNNRGVSLYPPGTPLVRQKSSGYRKNTFSWTTENPPQLFKVYRAEQAGAPFAAIAALSPGITNYTDDAVQSGHQYFYEVVALYATNSAISVPFVLTPLA